MLEAETLSCLLSPPPQETDNHHAWQALESESTLTCLLPLTPQETDNPDLRDRAYVYWRLLSSDPEAARSVVLAEKPVIAQDTSAMDPRLLRTLLGNLSTLSSVYHLPPAVRSLGAWPA